MISRHLREWATGAFDVREEHCLKMKLLHDRNVSFVGAEGNLLLCYFKHRSQVFMKGIVCSEKYVYLCLLLFSCT